jgi:hypothetical protein
MVAQATRTVIRSARVRFGRGVAALSTGGGTWGVFPALAADAVTARRFAARDGRPGGGFGGREMHKSPMRAKNLCFSRESLIDN